MKLGLQDKIDRDLPLTKRELVAASGYGIRAINRMKPPFVEGKIRLSDFWRFYTKLREAQYKTARAKAIDAWPAQSNDLRLIADKLRAPNTSSARTAASQPLAESPPHNSA